MLHSLKTWPEYFDAVWNGTKTFEIRRNDRNFRVGDWLQLEEWSPARGSFSGRGVLVKITYLTDYEQKPGFVVLAISPAEMISEIRGAWKSANAKGMAAGANGSPLPAKEKP